MIAAHDTPSAILAKAATTTIPIVFASGGDPVKLDLVASLNRPGGNVAEVAVVLMLRCTKRLDPYSITSSARASSVGGISRPSALAVLRLMTNSNLVGC